MNKTHNELAKEFLLAMLTSPKAHEAYIDDYVNKAFRLADYFIERSKIN